MVPASTCPLAPCGGHGLVGHRALIHLRLALDHLAVGGHPVTRTDQDEVARLQAGGSHRPGCAILHQQRRPRQQGVECPDARARPASGEAFEQFAEGEQEDDGRRLGCRTDQDGAQRGDRHQRLDAGEHTGARQGERPAAEEGQAHDGCGQVGPVLRAGHEGRDGHPRSQQQADGQRQPGLAVPQPRLPRGGSRATPGLRHLIRDDPR
jgi:hypothetical protein